MYETGRLAAGRKCLHLVLFAIRLHLLPFSELSKVPSTSKKTNNNKSPSCLLCPLEGVLFLSPT